MILELGQKVFISHRRLFRTDAPRYFVGVVDAYENGILRATGLSWFTPDFGTLPVRKPDPRTKILSISSGNLIVYSLPIGVSIENLNFEYSNDRLCLVEPGVFKMDCNECDVFKSRFKEML